MMEQGSNQMLSNTEQCAIDRATYRNADKFIEPVLLLMFGFGIFLAFFYDTWFIAVSVGGLCLAAYFITKKLLPQSNLYQYVTSAIFAVFAAQYIYQMHGMAEMHFWVFISSTILILYQNWRLQLPLILLVVVHHGTFAYLQYAGVEGVYFTQLAFMDLTTFIFHGVLAACVCLVSGIWSETIYQRTIQDALNYKALASMKAELEQNAESMKELNEELYATNEQIQQKNEQLQASEEQLMESAEELRVINENLNTLVDERTQKLLTQNETLLHHSFIHGHKVRSPLARIQGLVNLINLEVELQDRGKDLLHHLTLSANELEAILTEVGGKLDNAEFRDNRSPKEDKG